MAGRASGSVFGLAYGDALGAATEFLTMGQIRRRFGDDGPRELSGDPAPVTDDTQMAIAVAEALLSALEHPPFTPDLLTPRLRRTFLDWWRSPDNNRAPGRTCLRACANLADGIPWVRATQHGSKGCGANTTGAGWIAEEALATGLLCFLMFPEDPVSAIWRGAASSGDSDSIACLAGAFAGAHLGLPAWPSDWATRIEYATQLTRIGNAWD